MRQSVDRHLEHCIACREEYRLWEESERLIRGLADEQESAVAELAEGVNRNVMDRIYAEEGWFLSHRTPFQPLTRHFNYRFSSLPQPCFWQCSRRACCTSS